MRKLLLLITVLIVGTVASVAVAAPAKNTSGTIYASANHAEGDTLYVSGDFKDKLLGRGAIVYLTKITPGDPGSLLVKAQRITIYTTKGSLTGKGEAIQTFNPDGSTVVTDGTFALTKGTGKYKGHKFKGTFDGTFDEGVYTFKYKGKYK